jgi:plasmid stabilization system protein ParE
MNRFELAPECFDNLEQIVANAIEYRGASAAEELRDQVIASFQRLADTPGLGHRRPDLTSRPYSFIW